MRGSKETEAFKAAGEKTDETKAKPNGYLFNPDEDDDGSANSSDESSMCIVSVFRVCGCSKRCACPRGAARLLT